MKAETEESKNISIEILEYSPELRKYFKSLNTEWLNKYFKVEKIDELILDNPEEYVLKSGGFILFAKSRNTICGTVAMIKQNCDIYEMLKMAVSESYQGKQVGKKLALEAIDRAKKSGARRIILETNRKLNKAINLYRKLGFTELQNQEINSTKYKRPTFKMELEL